MGPQAVIVVALLCAWAYCACLLPLVAGQDSPPDMMIRYHVANEVADTDVGMRFDELFGEDRMEQIMSDATAAVWETLEIDHYPENTNAFTDVYLTVVHNLSRWNDRYAGVTIRNKIELNSRLFSEWDVEEGGMEPWVQAVVYHEMTHVWQVYPQAGHFFSREGLALKEGTAHYVAMRAGHTPPDCPDHNNGWILKRESWRQGYCPTLYFLRYLATPALGGDGIVAEINRRLNDHSYLEDDFVDLLGSTPDQLWQQFLETFPDDLINIGQLQVAGAGQTGRSKTATPTSYIY